jgi:hypothetical protein
VTRKIATLDLYCGLMEEIKLRAYSIQNVIGGKINPPFPGAIALEHCYVQIRMVCEIVAIGCIVIHNQTSAVDTFERLWSAKDIMNRLERLNPHFFPKAVAIVRHPEGSQIAFDIHPVIPPVLTKAQFLTLYGRCGDALHRGHLRKITANVPARDVKLDEVIKMITGLVNLLRAHQISSADFKNHYTCLMENGPPGSPCAIITAVSDPNEPPQPHGA